RTTLNRTLKHLLKPRVIDLIPTTSGDLPHRVPLPSSQHRIRLRHAGRVISQHPRLQQPTLIENPKRRRVHMPTPTTTMRLEVQVRASHITGSTLAANMLPSARHIPRTNLNRRHGRVVPVIGEHTTTVVDTDTNTRAPREDVPPSAVHLPRRRRIRVRTARIVNPSMERPTKKRPRPITTSYAAARRATPLPPRNVRLNTPSVTNIVLTANPLHKRIQRGSHRPASELAKRAPLRNRRRDDLTNRRQQQISRLRQPATNPPGNCRSSRLHALPRTRR